AQALRRTWGNIGRFLSHEHFIATPVAVVAGVGWLVSRTFLGLYLGLTAVAILLDFALTFVTPALAFSTRRAKEALAMGLRMIPSEWPRAALYVLVPPLAILLVAHLVPGIASFRRLSHDFDALTKGRPLPSIPESGRLLSAAFSAVLAVCGLLFNGGT